MEEIKVKYDQKCVYEYTGANSHFDEKSGCVCNVGYVLYKGTCEGRDKVIDNVLDDAYYKALSNMSEYTNIANREVVKSQAKDPANANLTIPQLIKKIYGNQSAVTTIVTTSTIAQTTKKTVPIKMTRAEYQAKYGQAPVVKSSLAENTKEDKMPPQIISTTSSTSSLEFSEAKIERSIPEVTNDPWFNKMVNWFKFKWLSKQS